MPLTISTTVFTAARTEAHKAIRSFQFAFVFSIGCRSYKGIHKRISKKSECVGQEKVRFQQIKAG